jgi:nicastrin
MLSVDQVGHAVANGILYVHADENNDSTGAFLANVLKYCGTNDVSVASSSVGNSGNGFAYPPSPLTSLLSLSGGAVGGAVLTGYDYTFTSKTPYHSHMDSAVNFSPELKTIAVSATILARAALAAAYDGGNNNNAEESAQYAVNLIPELSSKDEDLVELSNCLFYDGNCDLFKKYSQTEQANDNAKTGLGLGAGEELGTPPNYYVGVYNSYYGQPFVQVGDHRYGAYDGSDFGNKNSDAMGLMPSVLERSIHGLFNNFLGRGSMPSEDDEGNEISLDSCKKAADCSDVNYCGNYGDSATCTGGGQCVCRRAHYHIALDEALQAVENKPTGYFVVSDNDQGVSAMYAEPYWSPSVGVRVYRDVGSLPGFFTLVAGVVVGAASLFGALVLKVGLKKEKLY